MIIEHDQYRWQVSTNNDAETTSKGERVRVTTLVLRLVEKPRGHSSLPVDLLALATAPEEVLVLMTREDGGFVLGLCTARSPLSHVAVGSEHQLVPLTATLVADLKKIDVTPETALAYWLRHFPAIRALLLPASRP